MISGRASRGGLQPGLTGQKLPAPLFQNGQIGFAVEVVQHDEILPGGDFGSFLHEQTANDAAFDMGHDLLFIHRRTTFTA